MQVKSFSDNMMPDVLLGKQQIIIDQRRIETPLGQMIVGGTDEGICLLEFTDRKMLEKELKDLSKKWNAVIVEGNNPHFKTVEKQLKEYFAGKRKNFDVKIFTPGSTFQQRVWQQLQTIPYGKTKSYKEQAIAVGNVKAVRAVAATNGMNRIAIVIPCHRVIGSNGHLTGYAAGLWRKKYLLDMEKGNNG
jgi:AraC family transcriptional regulator of adaptative response/methylated-DNA-[protein]-cysteine methyltransferase